MGQLTHFPLWKAVKHFLVALLLTIFLLKMKSLVCFLSLFFYKENIYTRNTIYLSWFKHNCSFVLLKFASWYWNTFLSKCGYVIHHFNAHITLHIFFANYLITCCFIGKDSDAGRDWGQEEKGMTEDEMAGWHHWLDGRESEWTPGVGDGQGGLECCDSWGRKESDMTEQLIWSDLIEIYIITWWWLKFF